VVAEVVDARPAGDHTLFIGEVLHFQHSDGEPLIVHSGTIGGWSALGGRPDPDRGVVRGPAHLETRGARLRDPKTVVSSVRVRVSPSRRSGRPRACGVAPGSAREAAASQRLADRRLRWSSIMRS
jgi:hypothetical protein